MTSLPIPVDPEQTPEALEKGKQKYLVEQTLKGALRFLYGDTAIRTTGHIAHELADQLVERGVVLLRKPYGSLE